MTKKRSVDKGSLIFSGLLVIYGILCFYLYYQQLLYPETGLFESDTSVHVSFAVEEGYYHSLAAFIYVFLYKLPFHNVTIALTLSLVTVLSVYFTKNLILKINPCKKVFAYAGAFFANFVMGFYVKALNRQHYIGYQNANMWHNSTYTFMRLFAILTVLVYLDLDESYKEKINVKKLLLFTLFLTVATGFKASFLTVFAPVLAIKLLIDLIKGTRFSKVFVFALTVVPGLCVMALQSLVMGGSNGSNGYVISPFTALSMRGDHPKITLILSVLFPLFVGLYHIRDFYKDRIYFGSLIMWAVAFLEVFLLLETGERELDSNFFWGYSIALFFLFVTSMIRTLRDFSLAVVQKNKVKIAFLILCMILLFWHVISGLWYFGLLFTGVTYFV